MISSARKYSRSYDLRAAKARDKKAFVFRIKLICNKLVGTGYFELFPNRIIKFMNKYLAAVLGPGKIPYNYGEKSNVKAAFN